MARGPPANGVSWITCLPVANMRQRRWTTGPSQPAWRRTAIVDEWVQREARPVSLRQLTVFGRQLTKTRLLESAKYVREELPTRIAHRLRDLQNLPYTVITNQHMLHVYNLYFMALDDFRKVPEVQTLGDNEKFCAVLRRNLAEHLSVIPKLVMGLLECQGMLPPEATDKLMNTLLRSRISRRTIAEQHLALTEAFANSQFQRDVVGEVFLDCSARDVVSECAETIEGLCRQTYGDDIRMPEVIIKGHVDARLTFIPAHLEYIVGELLRNSFQGIIEQQQQQRLQNGGVGKQWPATPAHPIEVLICETPQDLLLRVSDRSGGVNPALLPYLWSFVKGPRRKMKLENLMKVPQLAATLQELRPESLSSSTPTLKEGHTDRSLSALAGRPPELRLGIGLPMSRVYAEYWAGSLGLRSLEGFGVDTLLRLPRLGNRNEQLSARASMDAL